MFNEAIQVGKELAGNALEKLPDKGMDNVKKYFNENKDNLDGKMFDKLLEELKVKIVERLEKLLENNFEITQVNEIMTQLQDIKEEDPKQVLNKLEDIEKKVTGIEIGMGGK